MRKIIIVITLIGLLCDIIGGALFLVAPSYDSPAFPLALFFILPASLSGLSALTLGLVSSLRRIATRLASRRYLPASDTRESGERTPFIRFRVVRLPYQDSRDHTRFIRQRLQMLLFLVVILVALLFILSGFGPLSGGLIGLGEQYVNSVHFGVLVALVLFVVLLLTLLSNIFAGLLEKAPPRPRD
jgi:hypothetical protein